MARAAAPRLSGLRVRTSTKRRLSAAESKRTLYGAAGLWRGKGNPQPPRTAREAGYPPRFTVLSCRPKADSSFVRCVPAPESQQRSEGRRSWGRRNWGAVNLMGTESACRESNTQISGKKTRSLPPRNSCLLRPRDGGWMPGFSAGRAGAGQELAVCLCDEHNGVHRSLGVLWLLSRSDAAYQDIQGCILHNALGVDGAGSDRVPLLPSAGSNVRTASGGFLRLDCSALPDFESHGEPAGGDAGGDRDGLSLLFLVERWVAVHRWRRERIFVDDDGSADLCGTAAEEHGMAVCRGSVGGVDGVLPVVPDRAGASTAGILLLCPKAVGSPSVARGVEAFRVGICCGDGGVRAVQHGGERAFLLLRECGGNGGQVDGAPQSVRGLDVWMALAFAVAGATRDGAGGGDCRIEGTWSGCRSQVRIVLAAFLCGGGWNPAAVSTHRATDSAAGRVRKLSSAGGFPGARWAVGDRDECMESLAVRAGMWDRAGTADSSAGVARGFADDAATAGAFDVGAAGAGSGRAGGDHQDPDLSVQGPG